MRLFQPKKRACDFCSSYKECNPPVKLFIPNVSYEVCDYQRRNDDNPSCFELRALEWRLASPLMNHALNSESLNQSRQALERTRCDLETNLIGAFPFIIIIFKYVKQRRRARPG
ncbi:unnamed protein product [Leptidea sinapis]|uniref:Uncharacterized protein n=1 Tax=Leptidea sinapis TaxID=189913 RepID=A0A5E4PW36_9NEOP|nr:unnamed protein product [Leptidea sinapis]